MTSSSAFEMEKATNVLIMAWRVLLDIIPFNLFILYWIVIVLNFSIYKFNVYYKKSIVP